MKTTLLLLLAVFAQGAEFGVMTAEQKRVYAQAVKTRDEAENPLLARQKMALGNIRLLVAAGKTGGELNREMDTVRELSVEIRSVEDRFTQSLAKSLTPEQIARLKVAAATAPRKTAATAKVDAERHETDEEERE